MGSFPVEIVLSLLGLIVATATFLREFVFVGRKRLGYRVQMNTPASRIQLTDANGGTGQAPDPAAQAARSGVAAVRSGLGDADPDRELRLRCDRER